LLFSLVLDLFVVFMSPVDCTYEEYAEGEEHVVVVGDDSVGVELEEGDGST